jgi:hypothetical protein
VNGRLEKFKAEILNFEAGFKKQPNFKPAVSACLVFPAAREEFLTTATRSQTYAVLVGLRKNLMYISYVLSARAVQAMMTLERFDFLRKFLRIEIDLTAAVSDCNDLIRVGEVVGRRFAQIFAKLKPFSVLSPSAFPLQFDDQFPQWKFPRGLGLDVLTCDQVVELKKARVLAFRQIVAADLGINLQKMCLRCQRRTSKLICQRCRDFVCCRKCTLAECPRCGARIAERADG